MALKMPGPAIPLQGTQNPFGAKRLP